MEGWKLGHDGDTHPTKPHCCLSIRETHPNWILAKTRQTYKQRNLRDAEMEKVVPYLNIRDSYTDEVYLVAWNTGLKTVGRSP